jgi:hypothetical protein
MIDFRHRDLHRQSEPLAPNEVDWMLLETALWPNDVEGRPEDPIYCATLLLSCSPEAPIGQRLARSGNQAHHQTCTYGRTLLSSTRDWIRLTGVHNRTIEQAVLFTDETNGLTGGDVDALVQSLKAAGVESVIVVCADARTRAGIASADGFVVGSVRTDLETAAMLTDIVHNGLYAPAKILCVDRDDLQGVLGSAQAPSILAEGVWHLYPFRFDFLADADRVAVETAGAVLVSPVLGSYRIAKLSQLRRDLLTRLRDNDVEVVCNWPMHGFQFAWNSPRAALLRLLCKP